jgi:hypothetical protein
VIAAGMHCRDECETKVWARHGDGHFERAGPSLPGMTDVRLGFAGIGGFVLVGEGSEGLAVFGSPDGGNWVPRSADIDIHECGIGSLVSGPGAVIVIDAYCGGAWLSRGV